MISNASSLKMLNELFALYSTKLKLSRPTSPQLIQPIILSVRKAYKDARYDFTFENFEKLNKNYRLALLCQL